MSWSILFAKVIRFCKILIWKPRSDALDLPRADRAIILLLDGEMAQAKVVNSYSLPEISDYFKLHINGKPLSGHSVTTFTITAQPKHTPNLLSRAQTHNLCSSQLPLFATKEILLTKGFFFPYRCHKPHGSKKRHHHQIKSLCTKDLNICYAQDPK